MRLRRAMPTVSRQPEPSDLGLPSSPSVILLERMPASLRSSVSSTVIAALFTTGARTRSRQRQRGPALQPVRRESPCHQQDPPATGSDSSPSTSSTPASGLAAKVKLTGSRGLSTSIASQGRGCASNVTASQCTARSHNRRQHLRSVLAHGLPRIMQRSGIMDTRFSNSASPVAVHSCTENQRPAGRIQ